VERLFRGGPPPAEIILSQHAQAFRETASAVGTTLKQLASIQRDFLRSEQLRHANVQDVLLTQLIYSRRETQAARAHARRAEREAEEFRKLVATQADTIRQLTARPTKLRSPAAALEPWELSESAAEVMRRVLDPQSPVGKPVGPARPAKRADASIIRRRSA
jgi:hypothetical protein